MDKNRTSELLYESASALRRVDQELNALGAIPALAAVPSPAIGVAGGDPETSGGLAVLPAILQRANEEIAAVLRQLRSSRLAIEEATADRLQATHEKIREVTSATEVAATGILDSLDRASTLVDELDADAEGSPTPRGVELRGQLRDEIFGMMGCMQFQDITTQQLNYAGSILVDLEQRLGEILRLFEPNVIDTPAPAGEVIYAPDASLERSEERQSLADAIFRSTGS